MKLPVSLVLALVLIMAGSSAQASLINLTLTINDLLEWDAGAFTGEVGELLVNGVPTQLPHGITFDIIVDDATADTWAPTDFGLFPVVSVHVTALDLGLDNVLVTTPLAYFEDDTAYERAGLSPLHPNAGAQVGFDAAGNTQIGDPNLIDTVPVMTGTSNQCKSNWSSLFSVTAGTQTISGNGAVCFGQSSLGPTPVPAPASLPMLLLGLGALGFGRFARGRD